MTSTYLPVLIARQFLYVREVPKNNGQRVNGIQMWCGGGNALGTSWCAWFVTFVLDIAYQGHAPIPRMGNCQAIRELAAERGMIASLQTVKVGSLFLYINAQDHAHHIGIVTGLDPLTGIAGNTSPDGSSPNGDGVYEHEIHAQVFIDYTRG